MNILALFCTDHVGGAELQFLELVNFLAGQGHTIRLVSLGDGTALNHLPPVPSIERIDAPLASGWLRGPLSLRRAAKRARGGDPNVILSTSMRGNVLAARIKRAVGAPIVSLQTVSKASSRPRLTRWALRSHDVLVAGHEDIRSFLLAEGHKDNKIHVIENWVDLSRRRVTLKGAEVRARLGLPTQAPLITCYGRLHPQKGQETLIRAFAQLRDAIPGAHLVLAGEGPSRTDLDRLAAPQAPHISFVGLVDEPIYSALLAASSVYVQPSRYEGLPRSLLDAMYLRCPVVASAVNGTAAVIMPGRTGLLVPPDDPAALSDSLQRVLTDPTGCKAMRVKAFRTIKRRFTMDAQLPRFEDVLRQVAG